jgi:hypothetical protein
VGGVRNMVQGVGDGKPSDGEISVYYTGVVGCCP